MTEFTLTVPDEPERGLRIECADHGTSEVYQPGRRKAAFHCEECGYELEITLHDLLEWRDLQEMC